MKLATLANGSPDGRLLVVSRDLTRATEAEAASTLQDALDNWLAVEPSLTGQYLALEQDRTSGMPLDASQLMAAIPRSYQFLDASAFLAHNHILAEAWGYVKRSLNDPPLMYQGLSDRFLPPYGEVSFRSADDEIDFEAEYGVITDRVPRGTIASAALGHVKLIVLINDWSLRAFGPAEMKAGFGFLHAKPPSALSGIAVTPDELGPAWAGGRIALRVTIERSGVVFGNPDGSEMSYDFGELIAHAAVTRDLCAGTVLGSGTIANSSANLVGSGCIAERRALDRLSGAIQAPYLSAGERVRLSAAVADGELLFGSIDQVVSVGSSQT